MDITSIILNNIESRLHQAIPSVSHEDINDAVMETVLISLEKCDKGDFVSNNHICKWIYLTSYHILLNEKTKSTQITDKEKCGPKDGFDKTNDSQKQLKHDTEIKPGSCSTDDTLIDNLSLKDNESIENYFVLEYDLNLIYKNRKCKPNILRYRQDRALTKLRRILGEL